MKNPQLAEGDQILALPTLVRRLPSPLRKFIGDMSSVERVLVGLDLRSHEANPLDREREISMSDQFLTEPLHAARG